MTLRRKTISRRDFLKYSAAAGAAAAIPWRAAMAAAVGGPYGVGSPNLTKFVDLIRPIGGAGIPLAAADAAPAPVTGALHYSIGISQFTDTLHSDFITPGKAAYIPAFTGTKLWGYGQGASNTYKHLGGIIVAQKSTPIQITFQNNLPPLSIVPIDQTIPAMAGLNYPDVNRTAVHLHGGFVPWISDGGPFDWFAANGNTGLSFLNNATLNPTAAPGQAEYYYPNNQTGRLMWYHDHAHDITRTNAYSGIASGYVLIDPAVEAGFVAANPGVPSSADLAAINSTVFYLIFQDKIFFPPSTTALPTGYAANAGPGDLFYAYNYNTALFGPQGVPSFGGVAQPLPLPSCVPEFFGDTILVNGTAYPVLEVEARPVRFRMLNACNARFLNPRLVKTSGTTFPSNAEPASGPQMWGPSFLQIGNECGYLPAATPVAGKNLPQLLMAPAERSDVLVDFSAVAPGTEFILYNDAPGPFPGGTTAFDYYPMNPKTPTSLPGFGPNTRTLLKVRVKAATGTVTKLPAALTMNVAGMMDAPLVTQTPGVPTPIPASVVVNGVTHTVTVRTLTLNEGFDQYGRLLQMLGTDTQFTGSAAGFFGRDYTAPATEVITNGSVEVWQLINLTADTHPIHFHLVNMQILYRQPVKTKGFAGTITVNPNGQPYAPDLNELGYKETIRMNPGEVTVVIAKFDLPTVPFTVPPSPRTGNNEYLYHCHILEHEEHDMMRPMVVI